MKQTTTNTIDDCNGSGLFVRVTIALVGPMSNMRRDTLFSTDDAQHGKISCPR